MFWYLLFLLVPLGIGAYLVWDHRRKAVERASASAQRLNAILGATTHVPEPLSTPPGAPAATASAPAAPALAYAARERLLSPPQTLVYYLLRTGLPEHLVFAHVTLRAVLEAAAGLNAYARNEQMRRLSWHTLDFVVCDRNLRPIAVIEVTPRGEQHDSSAMRKSWLESAGIRYLELEQSALPRKEAMRALVLGEGEMREKQPATGIDRGS